MKRSEICLSTMLGAGAGAGVQAADPTGLVDYSRISNLNLATFNDFRLVCSFQSIERERESRFFLALNLY